MEKQCMYIHWVLHKMGGKEVVQQASFLGLSLEEIVLLASCLSSQKLCVYVCLCVCVCVCVYVCEMQTVTQKTLLYTFIFSLNNVSWVQFHSSPHKSA